MKTRGNNTPRFIKTNLYPALLASNDSYIALLRSDNNEQAKNVWLQSPDLQTYFRGEVYAVGDNAETAIYHEATDQTLLRHLELTINVANSYYAFAQLWNTNARLHTLIKSLPDETSANMLVSLAKKFKRNTSLENQYFYDFADLLTISALEKSLALLAPISRWKYGESKVDHIKKRLQNLRDANDSPVIIINPFTNPPASAIYGNNQLFTFFSQPQVSVATPSPAASSRSSLTTSLSELLAPPPSPIPVPPLQVFPLPESPGSTSPLFGSTDTLLPTLDNLTPPPSPADTEMSDISFSTDTSSLLDENMELTEADIQAWIDSCDQQKTTPRPC